MSMSLSPKSTSLIQTVTDAHCCLAMKASERPRPFKDPNTIPWALPDFLYCHAPSYTFHCLVISFIAVFPHFFCFFWFYTCIYIYIYIYIYNIYTYIFFLCRSSQIQGTWISDWGPVLARTELMLQNNPRKPKISIQIMKNANQTPNTNNRKCKKKQVQTNTNNPDSL